MPIRAHTIALTSAALLLTAASPAHAASLAQAASPAHAALSARDATRATSPALAAAGRSTSPAFVAVGDSTTHVVKVKLRDAGAAVRVTLSLTCPAGATAGLTITVTAANGTRIAQGTGTVKPVACTGDAQEVAKRVAADPAGALFITGLATSRTVRTVCDTTGCTTIALDETIRIR